MATQFLLKVLGVLSVFVGFSFAIAVLVMIIRKLKLSSSAYRFAVSVGIGLIFGISSLGLILLSAKFGDWTFIDKLIYAGKFFPLVSFIFFIGMEVMSTKSKEENKKKIS